MRQSRLAESQIVNILGQAARNDMTARAACGLYSISEATPSRWKRKYGDMGTSEVKRLREFEGENSHLKRILAESAANWRRSGTEVAG